MADKDTEKTQAMSPLACTLYLGNLVSEANMLISNGRYSHNDLVPHLEDLGVPSDLLREMFSLVDSSEARREHAN